MSASGRYLVSSLGLAAFGLGLIGMTLTALDPFGLSGRPGRPGYTLNKPGLRGHDRLVKAHAIRRIAPDVMVLGTSRVQYGIDPDDARAFLPSAERPYNAALLNSSLYLVRRYVAHAQAAGGLRHVLVGLDTSMFDGSAEGIDADFSENRMLTSASGTAQPWSGWVDIGSTALSYDAIGQAARMLRHQPDIITDLLANGQRSPATLTRLFQKQGESAFNFHFVEASYAKQYRARSVVDSLESGPFRDLRSLIKLCEEQNIALTLFFTPSHVRLHEVARLSGQETAIDHLRDSVLALVKDSHTPVYDFAGYAPRFSAPLLAKSGEATAVDIFWDTTHFRQATGRLLLERMLSPSPSAEALSLGSALTPELREASRSQKERDAAAWRQRWPQEAADVAAHLPRTNELQALSNTPEEAL